MTVVAFPLRVTRLCASCLVAFVPLRPSHTLCSRCFSYLRFAEHVRVFRAALEAAR